MYFQAVRVMDSPVCLAGLDNPVQIKPNRTMIYVKRERKIYVPVVRLVAVQKFVTNIASRLRK